MFFPRLTKPLNTNEYYIKAPKGLNPCILGNEKHRDKYLTVLPNCVGYVCGRFNEIGESGIKYNLNMNAKDIFYKAKSLGLKTGTVPQAGALIVWGNAQYGHVACVEQVIDEKTIIVSQSGWNATKPFWTAKHIKGKGEWVQGDDYSWMKEYAFLGFVYNPFVKEDIMKQTPVKILYKGRTYTINDNFCADGKNYPAIREILETIGFRVGWDSLNKSVTIAEK